MLAYFMFYFFSRWQTNFAASMAKFNVRAPLDTKKLTSTFRFGRINNDYVISAGVTYERTNFIGGVRYCGLSKAIYLDRPQYI